MRELQHLKTLIINDNELTVLPNGFSELKSLEMLIISNNGLEKFPERLSDLKKLQTLIAVGNSLSDKEKARIKVELPHCKVYF
ncbi:MAG: hypothetical protein ACTHXJ_06905 [Mesonia sp.]